MIDFDFYKNKRILVTGHTGFKGTWLSTALVNAGANLLGYSRCSDKDVDFFRISGIEKHMRTAKGDIRDLPNIQKVFDEFKPEIVIHMAAQPIVRESYLNPVETYETNVLGTVNVLECVRNCDSVKSFLNVTTDKVYLNRELNKAFKENEPLDGFDPYSNSKSCSELVTHSYKNSFFADGRCAISTARAGNVIGGGDFAKDRIIPDCVRAAIKKESIYVRNQFSTRPYQHVLEPIFAYLMIIEKQYKDITYSGWYNIGPDDIDCINTGELVSMFCKKWGDSISWESKSEVNAPYESNFLKLDNSKAKEVLGWAPKWHINDAIEKTVDWYKKWSCGENIIIEMQDEIADYFNRESVRL